MSIEESGSRIFEVAMRKAITNGGRVRKADPVERLMQEHAWMHELLQAEHDVLKQIVEAQEAVLNVVSELGAEEES